MRIFLTTKVVVVVVVVLMVVEEGKSKKCHLLGLVYIFNMTT